MIIGFLVLAVLIFVFVMLLVGASIVFYLERREIKRIEHVDWLSKTGLRESSRVVYLGTSKWAGYQGW